MKADTSAHVTTAETTSPKQYEPPYLHQSSPIQYEPVYLHKPSPTNHYNPTYLHKSNAALSSHRSFSQYSPHTAIGDLHTLSTLPPPPQGSYLSEYRQSAISSIDDRRLPEKSTYTFQPVHESPAAALSEPRQFDYRQIPDSYNFYERQLLQQNNDVFGFYTSSCSTHVNPFRAAASSETDELLPLDLCSSTSPAGALRAAGMSHHQESRDDLLPLDLCSRSSPRFDFHPEEPMACLRSYKELLGDIQPHGIGHTMATDARNEASDNAATSKDASMTCEDVRDDIYEMLPLDLCNNSPRLIEAMDPEHQVENASDMLEEVLCNLS